MIYNVLKAIEENPVKNDFVLTCKKYLEKLKMTLTFEEIEKMSKFQLRKVLREKIKDEALVFLKSQQMKQEKIKNIEYKELKMQDYLAQGDRNISISKIIYKARGQTLDIKMHKKWKYDDISCVGCNKNNESGDEILRCENLGKNEEKLEYDLFFSEFVMKQISVGKIMIKKLKKRKKIREEVT